MQRIDRKQVVGVLNRDQATESLLHAQQVAIGPLLDSHKHDIAACCASIRPDLVRPSTAARSCIRVSH